MNFVIVSHEKSHVKDGFDCGIAELNQYLFRQAGQDVRKYYAALFVAIESVTNKVIGYYTLSNTSVNLDTVPPASRKKLPKYTEVPAIRLGRLAVDTTTQGQGVGAQLLADAAIRSVLNVSAWVFMTVNAKDSNACAFYKKFGFESLLDDARHLYIPRQDLETSFLRSKEGSK
ncbi:MAG: GNAT family N-acetyltransferase [Synergistaceae bacterium]|nr:GNAT family N-acetyltransferase [Synergistaceae bacterium]